MIQAAFLSKSKISATVIEFYNSRQNCKLAKSLKRTLTTA